MIFILYTQKSFVHISTLYSNCNLKYIGEKVYGQDLGYEKVLQMTRILDDVGLEKMQHCLVGEMPNTYTMTKKCSENLVSHKAHSLPAGIFRPPIGMLYLIIFSLIFCILCKTERDLNSITFAWMGVVAQTVQPFLYSFLDLKSI